MPNTPWLHLPSQLEIRYIAYGLVIGVSLSLTSVPLLVQMYQSRKRRKQPPEQFEPRPIELRSDEALNGLSELIGNTPLVRINSLSNALGVEILGKAEYLNPGGSVKDRVALRMITDAERLGLLHPHTGSRIFEGTVGSTGISIATVARARGYTTTVIMPDDVAQEKVNTLKALGADVELVRPVSVVDKKQFVNLARQRALDFTLGHQENVSHNDDLASVSSPRGFFADQFENKSNFDAHFEGTGPEIWRQTNGRLEAFVSGAGTGGTIAGIGQFIKSMSDAVIVALADPEGSGLFNKVKYGIMFDEKEREGTKRRHQVDTVVEGIGINRLTNNIELALPIVDDAFRVTDAEAVSMSRYVMNNDGFFLGSSSACNLVSCVKLAKQRKWNDGQIIVTILCDSGTRHFSKFWNNDYLSKAGIPVEESIAISLLEASDG